MDYVKEINLFQLNVETANRLDAQENYLNQTFITMVKTERSYAHLNCIEPAMLISKMCLKTVGQIVPLNCKAPTASGLCQVHGFPLFIIYVCSSIGEEYILCYFSDHLWNVCAGMKMCNSSKCISLVYITNK